jgi:hypothetical protein
MSSHGTVATSPVLETELGDLAALCDTVFGRDLTAYLAGAESVIQLAHWIDAGAPTHAPAYRLSVAADVIQAFAADNRVAAAAPWLRDVPVGGGSPPARTIRQLADGDLAGKDVPLDAAAFAAR